MHLYWKGCRAGTGRSLGHRTTIRCHIPKNCWLHSHISKIHASAGIYSENLIVLLTVLGTLAHRLPQITSHGAGACTKRWHLLLLIH